MELKVMFTSLVLVIFLFFSSNQYVAQGRRILSKEEDLELQRQLNILNKPPVKTIQTEEGDTFDCIDIYKQPILDHPMLKNHKIQMRPTSRPKGSIVTTSSNAQQSTNIFRHFNCPKGTVPIRRTRKEDLLSAKSFLESYTPSTIHPLSTVDVPPGHHAAGRKSSSNDQTNIYYGARGTIDVPNPAVRDATQFSSGQIWVEGGPPDHLNTLQAGWAVAPQLLGDNHTRFFVYSDSDVQNKTGCYNYQCTGFLLVDEDIALGSALTPTSVYGGTQYSQQFSIFQDNVTKHWWLSIGSDENEKDVGYWPTYWFPNLKEGAWSVAWGGFVKGTPNGSSPQMGKGHWLGDDYKTASSVVSLQTVDASNNWVNIGEDGFETFGRKTTCYDASYMGFEGESFLFGGPGGDNCGP